MASVLILGVFIGAAVRLPLVASSIIVGLFALFHGHAHGAEMPETASGMAYGLGFVFSTILLHISGVGFGLVVQRLLAAKFVPYAGALITVCGIYLGLASVA